MFYPYSFSNPRKLQFTAIGSQKKNNETCHFSIATNQTIFAELKFRKCIHLSYTHSLIRSFCIYSFLFHSLSNIFISCMVFLSWFSCFLFSIRRVSTHKGSSFAKNIFLNKKFKTQWSQKGNKNTTKKSHKSFKCHLKM